LKYSSTIFSGRNLLSSLKKDHARILSDTAP
jgi:hypothetical protein